MDAQEPGDNKKVDEMALGSSYEKPKQEFWSCCSLVWLDIWYSQIIEVNDRRDFYSMIAE